MPAPARLRRRWLRALGAGAFLAVTLGGPAVARADAEACVAASESEIGLRKEGKLHAAMEKLSVCAAPACPQEVREECGRRALALRSVIPSLVLAATDEAGNDLAAVTVALDGVPLATAIDGRPVSVDPGSHVLRFEAAGRPAVEKTIVVREAERERRVNVVLRAAAAMTPAPETHRSSSWSAQRSAAVATAGVGVAAVAVGSVFGLMAISDLSSQKSDCGTRTTCTMPAAAVSAHGDMVTAATVSTATFAVGGAALVGALVLWLTAPSTSDTPARPGPLARLTVSPRVDPRGGSLMLLGGFP